MLRELRGECQGGDGGVMGSMATWHFPNQYPASTACFPYLSLDSSDVGKHLSPLL